jgi:hypothetical protein
MRATSSVNSALSCLAILVGVLVSTVLFYRAQFGIDFTDECFYASLMNRLVLGGTLFVDEFAAQQLAALIVVPFAWVHRSVVGSTDGLILFLRWTYLATALILSIPTALALRKTWGFPAAITIGLIGLAYVPFNIITFSYNTLAVQLLTAGLFCGFQAVICTSRCAIGWTFLTGLLFSANLLAYPTFIVPQCLFVAIFAAVTRSWRKSILLVTGWAILPVALLAYLGPDGLANFRQSMSFCTPNRFGPEKLIEVWTVLWNLYPHKDAAMIGLPFLVPTIIVARQFVRLLSLAAIALLLVGFHASTDPNCSAMLYATYFAFTAPLSVAFLWRNQSARYLFGLVWLPSFIAGYVAALTSGNGALAMSIGIFPAMLAALALLLLLIRQGDDTTVAQIVGTVDTCTSFLVSLSVLGLFVTFVCSSVYRDAPLPELTDRVKHGPFAGLYTTPERNDFLRDLSHGLQSAAQPGERVLFFYNFPAGYLLSDLPCASNCSWQNKIDQPQWIGHHHALKHYWLDPAREPVVIVLITTTLTANPHLADSPFPFGPRDPFLALLQTRFTPSVEHRHFKIYRRNAELTGQLELPSPF